jgi:ABC-type multidrug transport system ATPase subunit
MQLQKVRLIDFSCKRKCFKNKGYSNSKEQICSDLVESVNLRNDRNVLCQNLSGGMKRRLSIACAFIGDAKLVLLGKFFFF